MKLENIFINGDLILVLSIAILCDMISGSVKAILTNTYKSGNFRTGLLKKGLDYVLVIVSILVGYVLGIEYIEPATVTVLIFMELSSIVENCNDFIHIPAVLDDVIKENTEKEESNESEEEYNG